MKEKDVKTRDLAENGEFIFRCIQNKNFNNRNKNTLKLLFKQNNFFIFIY